MNRTIILVGIFVILLFVILYINKILYAQQLPKTPKPKSALTCDKSCGDGVDHDINEPDYNIKEVIKNTLLLEMHLADKSKYCKPCSCKHMLINEALLLEATWIAGSNVHKYPKLEESLAFHQALFKYWHADMINDEVRLKTLADLREWRREMMELYYFS